MPTNFIASSDPHRPGQRSTRSIRKLGLGKHACATVPHTPLALLQFVFTLVSMGLAIVIELQWFCTRYPYCSPNST